MDERQAASLLKSSEGFPLYQGVKLSYGTAGFRADALSLESTVYRVGILAALRSLKLQSAAVGLMITASHNKVSDNGVKVADPNGGMLSQEWEPFADQLANASSSQDLVSLVQEFVEKEKIRAGEKSAEVWLGRDTRPSGEILLQAAKMGVSSIMGSVVCDMGVLTTPQLHWMVRARNKGLKATEKDYFEQLSSSFRCLMELIPGGTKVDDLESKLLVDGANGVGGQKLEDLKGSLNNFVVEIRNTGKNGGVLNEGVGADFVQKEKVVPSGFSAMDAGLRCASLDGDADRLVYFFVPTDSTNTIELLDGDKISSLFALFMKEQVSILNKKGDQSTGHGNCQVRLGVVQTAYANGASTNYLKQLGLDVVFAKTGVKHLHEKAVEFDIGIYFEANGHGTILFSESLLSWLKAKEDELATIAKGSEEHNAALRLVAVSNLINQAVGDALSGLLLVEVVLQHMGWSVQKWNELYQDLPSRQLKVKVPDRTAVATTNEETEALKPSGIQDAINIETARYPEGRAFIRPSGTEDVVRVYAEASTQEAADSLANSVAQLVEQFLGHSSTI